MFARIFTSFYNRHQWHEGQEGDLEEPEDIQKEAEDENAKEKKIQGSMKDYRQFV
ncbi:hypothetical protein BDZ91DRAFT_736975 [Kalaharituber pfeilii]|nr:hypothetical protein BDZ91DRAFT_736975 [Kalaharituber pfeilii]